MTEEQVHEGCRRAASYAVGSVIVRPCDLDLARSWVQAPLRLASRTSAAPGDATTAVKLFEVQDMLQRGASLAEAKVNLPKMMSRQFAYVEGELQQLVRICTETGTKLTASVDVSLLDEEQMASLCEMAKNSGVAILSASEYRIGQVEILLRNCVPQVEVKLMIDGKSLEEVLILKEMGIARFGVRHPAALLDAWKAHLETLPHKEELSAAVVS